MAAQEDETQVRRLERYLSDLESAHKKVSIENAQLRASHSYRLGHAFVQFAKRPRVGGAVTLFRDIRNALRPLVAHAPRLPQRPSLGLLTKHRPIRDALQKAVDESPVGSQIVAHNRIGNAKVTGILSASVAHRIENLVVGNNLALDRYDIEWASSGPTHLIIDVDALRGKAGWENAFTLRDPAATIELVAMLHKARLAGMKTVLIEPSEPYRYPLLSRARSAFDISLQQAEVTIERLAAA